MGMTWDQWIQIDDQVSLKATGIDHVGGVSQLYTFAKKQSRILIQNAPSSPATLYVLFNGAAVTLLDWDLIVEAGDIVENPLGMTVNQVAIWATAAAKFMTTPAEFMVRGLS